MKSVELLKTKLIAHRGLSSAEVENTLPAFILAGKTERVWGIECDVRVSSDGKFVVFHDSNLKRMCGVDAKVEKLALDEIVTLPLYDGAGKLSKKYHIPTLNEYLNICKTYDKVAVIEIKSKMTPAQLRRFYNEIVAVLDMDKVVVISFYMRCLAYMRLLDKKLSLQYLCEYRVRQNLLFCRMHNIGVDLHYRLMTPKTIAKCKRHGIATNVWVVDDAGLAEWFAGQGVDYITSNTAF